MEIPRHSVHNVGAGGSPHTSQAPLFTSVTDWRGLIIPTVPFLINFYSGKMEQLQVNVDYDRKETQSKRSNFKKMKTLHAHTRTRTQRHRWWGSTACQRSFQAQRRPVSGFWSSCTLCHRGCPWASPHDAAVEAGQISPPPGFLPKHTHPLQSARTLLGGTSAKLVQNPFRVGALTRICRDGLGSSLLQRDQIHDQPNRQSSFPLPHASRLGPL